MSDFIPSSTQYPQGGFSEQPPVPIQFTDNKEANELSSELKEIFSRGLEYLDESPILKHDVQRLEQRTVEVVEYPNNVSLFGTSKKTLDHEDMKRVHSLDSYEFKRNGPETEVLKVSVLKLKDNSNAREFVERIEEGYAMKTEKAQDLLNTSMQGVETRMNRAFTSFDRAQVFRKDASKEAYKTLESIVFSFEDAQERKECAVVIKRVLGGVYMSVIDFRNPDRSKMYATETPVPLENFDENRFAILRDRVSKHVNSLKRDID